MQLIYNLIIQQYKVANINSNQIDKNKDIDVDIDINININISSQQNIAQSINIISDAFQTFFESKSYNTPLTQFFVFIHSKISYEGNSYSIIDILSTISGPALHVLDQLGYSNLTLDIQKAIQDQQSEKDQRRAKCWEMAGWGSSQAYRRRQYNSFYFSIQKGGHRITQRWAAP